MVKALALALSGILSIGILTTGCGSNSNKVLQNKEQQIQSEEIEKAYEIADQVIGHKYDDIIGNGLIKRENKIELMIVGEDYRFMNINEAEELKNNLIKDCEKIIILYDENNINIDFEINMKTYPAKKVFFTMNRNGIILDNVNDDFISNESNWK